MSRAALPYESSCGASTRIWRRHTALERIYAPAAFFRRLTTVGQVLRLLLLSCACTNPLALEYVVMMIVIFLHVGPFAAHVIADLETQIAAIDRGERSETMRVGQDQAINRTAGGYT